MPRCRRECGCYPGATAGSELKDHPEYSIPDRSAFSKPEARLKPCKPESKSICQTCYRDLLQALKALKNPAAGEVSASAQPPNLSCPPASSPPLTMEHIVNIYSGRDSSGRRKELPTTQSDEGMSSQQGPRSSASAQLPDRMCPPASSPPQIMEQILNTDSGFDQPGSREHLTAAQPDNGMPSQQGQRSSVRLRQASGQENAPPPAPHFSKTRLDRMAPGK